MTDVEDAQIGEARGREGGREGGVCVVLGG